MSEQRLALARDAARSKGGECLSTEYLNAKAPMSWRCSSGHEWEACFDAVRNSGNWCPKCANLTRGMHNKTRTIDSARKLAESRGGKCLSDTYKSVRTKMDWECARGHRWSAIMHNMMANKAWCPTCAGRAPLSIEVAQAIAAERGGECVSETYVDNKTALEWKCADGHHWMACLHSVKDRGSWCPTCQTSTESLCYLIVGTLFPRHSFIKTRSLPWLRTSTGQMRLELDMWCEELRLAFEYNGRQHYEIVPRFHVGGAADLSQQQANDLLKQNACSDQEVCLITIPYHIHKQSSRYLAKKRLIAQFIADAVLDLGYPAGTHLSKECLLVALGC